ncbi:MAG: DNRLRE domain-containing protein [Candidatus Helarchaeota archaeon]
MKHKRVFLILLVLMWTSLLSCSSGAAATLNTFNVTADTYVVDDSPNGNMGNKTLLYVDDDISIKEYALLYFDLNSLSGHTLINATLTIETKSMYSGVYYEIFAANSSWAEDVVTWNTRPGFHTTPNIWGPIFIGNVTINITVIVADWISGAINNYGFLIKAINASDGFFTFYSREMIGKTIPTLTVWSIEGTPSIPSLGILWLVGIITVFALVFYLIQRSQTKILQ